MAPALQFSLKGLAALRLGVIRDQILTCNAVPVVKAVTQVNIIGRKKSLHHPFSLRCAVPR